MSSTSPLSSLQYPILELTASCYLLLPQTFPHTLHIFTCFTFLTTSSSSPTPPSPCTLPPSFLIPCAHISYLFTLLIITSPYHLSTSLFLPSTSYPLP
ncbi:hypothetical protein FKM82_023967 [Ascaphus truei]